MSAICNTLFVYGTLMPGQANSALIPTEAICQQERASILATLYDTENGYPALTLGSTDVVWGECLHIHPEKMQFLLQQLDVFEEFFGFEHKSSMYHRVLLTVNTLNGQQKQAWCYVAANQTLLRKPILSGCWKNYLFSAM